MSTTTTVNTKAATWVDKAHPSVCYYGRTSYLALLSGGAVGAVQFATPTPPGGQNVQAATLTLRTRALPSGSVAITVARLLNPWTPGKATWSNLKQATADAVTVTRSDAGKDGTLWSFDVSAMVQHWASGAPNYGVLITTGSTKRIAMHGNMSAALNPHLSATYTQAPLAPTDLAPAGGRRVSVARPLLRFRFQDQAGNTTLAAAQVQVATDAAMTKGLWDSGRVATAVPQLDLAAVNATMPAEGTPWFWRVRTQDGSGLWSDWSAPASAVFSSLPTVTLLNPDPKSPVVYDTTPPIDWTYASPSGSAQSRWRVQVFEAKATGEWVTRADSGNQFSAETAWTPTTALPKGGLYRVEVTVWDSYPDREAVPAGPTGASAVQDFTLTTNAGVPAPTDGHSFKPEPGTPAVTLTWSRADQPDGWRIIRNGTQIASTDTGAELLAKGQANTYTWSDPYPPAGPVEYLVAPVVNGASGAWLRIVVHNSFTGTWLVNNDTGEAVCIVSDDDHGLTMPEQATTVDVLGAKVPVRIVTAMQGWAGKADGMFLPLAGMPPEHTVDQWADRMIDFKTQVGQVFTLLGVGPLALQVLISEVDVAPVSDLNGSAWSVSFNYVQCDDFPDGLDG